MDSELNFVPGILLCGDETEFASRVGNRPYKIVGHVELSGTADGQKFDFAKDGKALLDDKLCKSEERLCPSNILSTYRLNFFTFTPTRFGSCGI